MPWWFRSFLIILTGLLLMLASDVAARAGGGGGLGDANALRLVGAALMGVGVCVGLGAMKQPRKRARKG